MLCLLYYINFLAEPYEVAKESVAESLELSVDKKDVSVQFNYITPSNGANNI